MTLSYSTIGWDVISNVLKWFKRKQNLLSKEHYCYKIYISLMKSSDIPHFYKTLIPSFDFSKISISYKWESRYEKTKQFFIIHIYNEKLYIFPTQFWIASLVKILQAKFLQLYFQKQKKYHGSDATFLHICFIYFVFLFYSQ